MPNSPSILRRAAKKALFILLPFAVCADLAAFELPDMRAAQVSGTGPAWESPVPSAVSRVESPGSPRQGAAFAAYTIGGVEVIVPNIGGGLNVMAVLRQGADLEALSVPLRKAFGSAAGAKAALLQPQSPAETELAARNPGAAIVSLNPLLPPGAAALFNREAGFAGPNCFNAAFSAAGLLDPARLRHVGNPEADQLLSMYYKKVPSTDLKPGDVLVLNDGDHGAYYLGGGLIFHKKSYLKQHIYRIVLLKNAYEPEPNEWKPGPFDDGPFGTAAVISKTEAWRRTGAQYDFGTATADELAKTDVIIFMADNIEKQAPRWAFSKEIGYFTELLLENLVSDWSAMAKSGNPVLKAYYFQLESLRDQANQSIELELLSSPYSQSHADEILKKAWLPRNDYSRVLAGKLLKIYGRDPASAEKALDDIGRDYNGAPLSHIK
ncbi:MAG: hypothetical protein WCK76_13600 [Elusimicrobiota bacterium]